MLNNTTRQSEESFRLLVEGVRDYAIFMLDTTGNIVSWNAGAERIMGYQASEILGTNFSRFYLQQDTDSGKPQQELQLASLVGSCEDEGLRIRQDGSPFWASVIITSLKEHGIVVGFSVIVHDLTERKLIEEELCHANRFLRLLCDCNQALVRAKEESELLADICRLIVETGKYSACSVEMRALNHTNSVRNAAFAGNEQILKQAETLEEIPHLIKVALNNGSPGVIRQNSPQNPYTTIKVKLGSAIILPLTNTPAITIETQENETNNVFGVITIYTTLITAFDPQEIQLLKELADDLAYGIMALRSREFLKTTEIALRESEERYRDLVELLPESVMVQEAGRITFINPAGLKLLGAKSPAQLLGQPVFNFVAQEYQETAKQRIQTCQQTRKESPFIEEKFLRLDGSEVFVESAGIFLGGCGQGLLVVSRDLSERKQMEAALRQSEELHRLTLSNISEAVFIADKAGNLTYISPNIHHVFETSYEQLMEKGNIRHLLGENFLIENPLETSDNHNIELEITTPSGKTRTLLVSVKQVAIGSGTVLYTCRDISDYKQARVALKQNEELLTQMLETLPVGVWFSDPQGKICQVNRAGREIWGGVRYVGLEEYGEYKGWWASNGQPIAPHEWALVQAVQFGHTCLNQVIDIETFDGKRKTVLNSALPLRKPNGEILGALAVNQDITELRQIQEALFESNRRIAKILESITDGFLALDPQRRITFVNSQAEKLLQKKREQLLGKTLCEVFPNAIDSVLLEKYQQIITSATAESFEGFYKPLNRWFEVHAYPGEEGLAVYFQDVTERKQAREALVESTQQLQAIFEAALDAMLIVNDSGHYVAVNPAAGTLLNAPIEEIIGHHIVEFIAEPEFNFDVTWEIFKEVGRITGEMQMQSHHGSLKDVDYSAVANFLPGRHLFVIRDITERKCTERELKQYREQLEELVAARTQELTAAMEQLNAEIAERSRVESALRASEEQLRTLINSTPDIICFKDGNGRWLLANEAISQLFELEINQLIGRKDTELAKLSSFYHDCFLICAQTDESAWNHKKLSRAFEAIPTSKGETKIYDVIKVPLFEADGTRKGLVVLGRDITKLKSAQEELGRLASIVESSDDAIIGTSLEGIIVSWNAGAEAVYGYSAAEVKGRNCSILAQPNYPQEMQQILERIKAGDRLQHYETIRIKKDGQPINVSLTISPIFDEQGTITGISRIARDITERKRIEAALERLRHQNELILTSAGEGICGLDAQGNIAFVNPAASRMLGYEIKELLGQSVHILLQFTQTYERRCRIFASLEDGSVHHVTDQMFCHKNGRYFPVEYVSTPIRERNEITGAVITFKDITERLAMERMKDEFISMVSHELRTPLTSIRGSMGLLASGILLHQPEKAQRMLEIAVANTDRLVRLINDILDLERIESGKINIEKQLCNVGDLMVQAAEDLQLMAQKAGITLEVDALPVQLWADPDRIVQTLTNLLSNAIKFSPVGSTVWLTGNPPSEGKVTICVQDQGRGIPSEKLEMIFERFQQVDASDSRQKGGTGLGLAICRSIVQQHGGRIWAESSLSKGSCFCFSLPIEKSHTGENC